MKKRLLAVTLLAVFGLTVMACEDTPADAVGEELDVAVSVAEEEMDVAMPESDTEEMDESVTEMETPEEEVTPSEDSYTPTDETDLEDVEYVHYEFRNEKLLDQHYEKHGIEMNFESAEAYEEAACEVINNPEALYKEEEEDGDGVYYLVDTNEFVILSTDGYIRTYFEPSAGLSYFERQ